MVIKVRVQSDDFDVTKEIDALCVGNNNIGAVVTFTGKCRDEDDTLKLLELEHYPDMAEAEIQSHAQKAVSRFDLFAISAIHRYGKISPGENIVLVVATSKHRQAAFDGANFLMDFLKTNAPFWKKNHFKDGKQSNWVSANDKDDDALEKWKC